MHKDDGGNVVGWIAYFGNQVFDFLGNHTGFTAARTCKHKQRAAEILHSLLLLRIEFHKSGRKMKR